MKVNFDNGVLTIELVNGVDISVYDEVNKYVYLNELNKIVMKVPKIGVLFSSTVWSIENILTIITNEVSYFFYFLNKPIVVEMITDDLYLHALSNSLKYLPFPIYNDILVSTSK